jgi:hypothetical protein
LTSDACESVCGTLPVPFDGSPSNAANTASLSKRGKHSRSIDPSRPTSAAVPRSPISA